MQTECIPKLFEFQGVGKREVVAKFEGGTISSDAGVLLLSELDTRRWIVRQFAECIIDHRDAESIEFSVETLIRQRTYALALGYEDLNDHDFLRADPLIAAAVGVTDPLGTITARDHHGLVCSFLTKYYGTSIGATMAAPVPTVTGQGQHLAVTSALCARDGASPTELRVFLVKYYGAATDGQSLRDPLHTVTSKARFGLVTVAGQDYRIVDIRLRMLRPRELARGQGFPDRTVLIGTQEEQIERIGNSVSPPIAYALVRANLCRPRIRRGDTKRMPGLRAA